FSGYSGAVLVYNHFHDVCAFFPLWLLLFDRLMQEKKRIGFILMTGFMAVLNYYFFVGEAVFLTIYFFCRYFYDGNPGAIKRGFARMGRALYCSIAGVLCAVWYLIPAITYTLGNSRLSDTLMGNSLVAYDEPVMLLGIIKNVMLLPDLSGLNSMFNAGYSRVSGVGGYLPLVSLSCVIAYFIIYKKKQNQDGYEKWPARLTVTVLIFAVIPGLNALFSALNSEYYARWYFMPILVMSLMSALVLEDAIGNRDLTVPLLKGNTVVAVMIAFFCICAVLPAINDDGERTILGALKNPDQLLCQLVFSIIMTFIFFIIIWFVLPKSKTGVTMACSILLAAMVTHATMFVFGESLVDEERKQGFIVQGIKGAEDIVLPNEDIWCRIETEQDVYNYPMIWNRPTITAFISTTSSGTLDFYHGIGLNRKVTSKLGVTRAGARTLFAGRYFLVENGKFSAIERIGRVEDEDELTNFTLIGECNGFDIYENNYFVPMGIVLDEYIKEENFVESKASSATLDRLLMKALILDDEAVEKYGYLLKEINQPDSISIHKFAMICDERCETACDSFTVNKKGFAAHINMEEEKLVLFAVPSDPGFKAYIDGNETPIITVDFGLMAVCVPKGEHDISFEYTYGNVYRDFADRFLLNKK
ncbi:MAG: YfhO family protein, partial [Lachnospiraceae bacterium]|nr:YfhO family protein [Lachnospiraceae bacterium]